MVAIPNKRFLVFGSIVSALAWSNYAIQPVLFNLTGPIFIDFINESVKSEFNITPSSSCISAIFALLTSSTYIGALIAMTGGHLGNLIGRRRVLMIIVPISSIIGSLLMIMSYSTNSIFPLILGRILSGISAAFTCFVTVPYIIEFTPKETKGFLPSLHSAYNQSWALVAMILSLPSAFGTAKLWPWLVSIPILPAVLLLLSFFVSPESPGWLYVQQNDESAARIALKQIYKNDDLVVEKVLDELAFEKEICASQVSAKELWNDVGMRRGLILCLIIKFAAIMSGEVINKLFSTSMLIQIGLGDAVSQKLAIISEASIILGSFICPVLTKFFGYRQVFLGALISAFLFGLGMYGSVALFKTGYITDPFISMTLSSICLCMNNLSYGAGLSPLKWFYMSEFQMTCARTTANVILFAVAMFIIFMVSFVYPVLQNVIGISAYPVLVSLPTLPLLIYLFINLPETKNMSSAEINETMARQANSSCCFQIYIRSQRCLNGIDSESTCLIQRR